MASNTQQEYISQLDKIQNQNPPSIAILPQSEKIYDIDLATRTIDSPKFLSVLEDHKAETIYFRVDRFFDYMDLATTVCIIQYITPDKQPHIYCVPFYDVVTEREQDKMLLPWCIDGAATQFKGEVKYSLQFFKIIGSGEEAVLAYKLNTLPAKSVVLQGLEYSKNIEDLPDGGFDIPADKYSELLQEIHNIKDNYASGIRWTIITLE